MSATTTTVSDATRQLLRWLLERVPERCSSGSESDAPCPRPPTWLWLTLVLGRTQTAVCDEHRAVMAIVDPRGAVTWVSIEQLRADLARADLEAVS